MTRALDLYDVDVATSSLRPVGVLEPPIQSVCPVSLRVLSAKVMVMRSEAQPLFYRVYRSTDGIWCCRAPVRGA